jgi:rubrerythrin
MAEVIEVLAEALDLEQSGEQFYREAAESCEEEVSRKTFLSLAEQERLHAKYFQAFYDAMIAEHQWPAAGTVKLEDLTLPELAKQVFQEAMPELGQEGPLMCARIQSLYDTAMEKERMSIALYEAQAQAAENEDEKSFFEFLVEQEKGHLTLLDNTQKYLDDPAHFFFDEEQWIVEG